jgi:hypothetical protein
MTNPPSPRVQKLVTLMQKSAEQKFAEAKKEKDAGMMAMYAADARDMFKIAELMRDGNFNAAGRKAWDMDTAARDEIPDKVYEFLMGEDDDEDD